MKINKKQHITRRGVVKKNPITKLKSYVVVEYFEGETGVEPSYENNIVKARTKKEARNKVWNDDKHTGEIVDVYEGK